MNKTSFYILSAAVLAATTQMGGNVPLPVPTGPNTPLEMAQAHEARVAQGYGNIFPVEIPQVRMNQGTIILDENHNFPTGFLEGLVSVDFEGVDTYPVAVSIAEDGTFLFQNAEEEIFWWIEPASPSTYDPLWLFMLKGGDSLALRLAMQGYSMNRITLMLARMEAQCDPGRVVSEWTLVTAEDAAEYRAAR